MVWLGSDDHETEFRDLFCQVALAVHAGVYYIDSDEGVLADFKARLNARGLHMADGATLNDIDATVLLSPGQRSRLAAHSKRREQLEGLSGAYFSDLEQGPSFTSAGPTLATLTRKMTLWNHQLQRPATGRELLLSLGVPSMEHGPRVGSAGSGCYYSSSLRTLSSSQVTQLCGNAMHMASMGAWVMYCLSNLMCKSDLIGNFKFEHHMLHSGGSSSCLDCKIEGEDGERKKGEEREEGKEGS
jgi:hypothetical protein